MIMIWPNKKLNEWKLTVIMSCTGKSPLLGSVCQWHRGYILLFREDIIMYMWHICLALHDVSSSTSVTGQMSNTRILPNDREMCPMLACIVMHRWCLFPLFSLFSWWVSFISTICFAFSFLYINFNKAISVEIRVIEK